MAHTRVNRIIVLRDRNHHPITRLRNLLAVRAYALESGRTFTDLSYMERIPVFGCVYSLGVTLFIRAIRSRGVMWVSGAFFSLPPTAEPYTFKSEFGHIRILYGVYDHFYNPAGLTKHREDLIASVPLLYRARVSGETRDVHKKDLRIGVYNHLTPYQFYPKGQFLISEQRMSSIVGEYTATIAGSSDYTVIATNDSSSLKEVFGALAGCDVIITCNSPVGSMAAWVADVPCIVATNRSMDWEFYQNKPRYFENIYATGVLGLYEND